MCATVINCMYTTQARRQTNVIEGLQEMLITCILHQGWGAGISTAKLLSFYKLENFLLSKVISFKILIGWGKVTLQSTQHLCSS